MDRRRERGWTGGGAEEQGGGEEGRAEAEANEEGGEIGGLSAAGEAAEQDSPVPACLRVPACPAAEAWGRRLWQPSLGARGPGKAGLVPGLRQT